MSYKHGPKIVTNGLVLYLDAANTKSYPKSGTSWYDLSGNRNTGTLTNGPTFNSADGGSIVFDGSNDYVDFFAPNLGTTATIEMWVKLGAAYSNKMFFGWLNYDVYCASGNIGYNTNNGDIYGITSATVSSLGLVNNWKHYIFEMRSDVAYTNNKIYINGVNQSLSQILGSEVAASRTFNSGNGRIADFRAEGSYNIPMNCASFKVYNRALSASEVLQNYNATKGRFSL